MHIKGPKEYPFGYTPITTMGDQEQNTRMDFGLLRLAPGQRFTEAQHLERAYLLIHGEVTLEWDGEKQTVSRENCFDFSPWVLHVPNDVEVTITAGADSELTVHRTDNETMFDARLYTPEECASEERGKGTMREASTRIVRTVFDHSNAPYANLVVASGRATRRTGTRSRRSIFTAFCRKTATASRSSRRTWSKRTTIAQC